MDPTERKDLQEHALRLRGEVEAELKGISGVVGVGVGFKETAGRRTDEIVFRVYVDEKRPLDAVAPAERIPPEIRGVRTDVLAAAPFSPQADDSKYRPIRGGIQIGNGSGGAGTLGCLAKRNAEHDWVILSNHHILFSGDKAVGEDVDIGQPDYSTCCCCSCNGIGKVLNGSVGGLVDCAIASIDTDVTKVHEVLQIGAVAGSAAAELDDTVRKRGRTTGLTRGTVIDVAFPVRSNEGLSFTDQLLIEPAAGIDSWAERGDSGAAVLNQKNQVVGIHWGGNAGHGVASKIANVMAAMNITIPGTVGADHHAVTPGRDVAATLVARRPWEEVLDRFLYDDYPIGRLVRKHRQEVWGLIRERRAVTVAWHRRQGPAFVAAFHRSATTSGYCVPDDIHDVSFAGLLMSMAAALEEHGSPALQYDVRRFAAGWIHRFQECRTAAELLTQIAAIEAELTGDEGARPLAVGR